MSRHCTDSLRQVVLGCIIVPRATHIADNEFFVVRRLRRRREKSKESSSSSKEEEEEEEEVVPRRRLISKVRGRTTRYRSQLPARNREEERSGEPRAKGGSSFVAQNAEQWRTDVVPWNASRRVDPTGYRLRSSSFLPILEPTTRRRWRRRRPPRSRNGAFTDILSTDAHIFPSAPILFSPRFFRLGCPSKSLKRRVSRSIFFHRYYRFVRSRLTSFFVRIIRSTSS